MPTIVACLLVHSPLSLKNHLQKVFYEGFGCMEQFGTETWCNCSSAPLGVTLKEMQDKFRIRINDPEDCSTVPGFLEGCFFFLAMKVYLCPFICLHRLYASYNTWAVHEVNRATYLHLSYFYLFLICWCNHRIILFAAGRWVTRFWGADLGSSKVHRSSDQRSGEVSICCSKRARSPGQGKIMFHACWMASGFVIICLVKFLCSPYIVCMMV